MKPTCLRDDPETTTIHSGTLVPSALDDGHVDCPGRGIPLTASTAPITPTFLGSPIMPPAQWSTVLRLSHGTNAMIEKLNVAKTFVVLATATVSEDEADDFFPIRVWIM